MTWLARQFFEHTITRKYLALVWGDLEQDGTVTGYIGRSINDRRIMSIYDDPEKGKWSVTHYKVIGTAWLRNPDRMPAGNWPHAPDKGTHEAHWPPFVQRR